MTWVCRLQEYQRISDSERILPVRFPHRPTNFHCQNPPNRAHKMCISTIIISGVCQNWPEVLLVRPPVWVVRIPWYDHYPRVHMDWCIM